MLFINSPVSIEELSSRISIVELLPKNSVGAEIGVKSGDFAQLLHQYTKPSEFHLFDFWRSHPRKKEEWEKHYQLVLNRFGPQIESEEVKLYEGDFSNTIPTISNNYLDWAYVDGHHNYEDVKKDISLILPKMKRGGVLSGHDFCISLDPPIDWGTGVIRAVIELIQNTNAKMIGLTRTKFASWVVKLP